MSKEGIVATIIATVVIILGVLSTLGLYKEQVACEKQGGVYIKSGVWYSCIDAKTIKIKKEY